jgi:putative transposase
MKRQTSITYGENVTYFVTTTITEFTHIFQIKELAQIVLDNIKFYQDKFDVLIHGFVIMPNHIHLLLTMTDKGNISQFMGQMKEYSAKQIIEWCEKNNKDDFLRIFLNSAKRYRPDHSYQVWQARFDDVVISSKNVFDVKLEYIHNNPLQDRWRLVEKPDDYDFSNAEFYFSGGDCSLDIMVSCE